MLPKFSPRKKSNEVPRRKRVTVARPRHHHLEKGKAPRKRNREVLRKRKAHRKRDVREVLRPGRNLTLASHDL
jgi:hypothetical protein